MSDKPNPVRLTFDHSEVVLSLKASTAEEMNAKLAGLGMPSSIMIPVESPPGPAEAEPGGSHGQK